MEKIWIPDYPDAEAKYRTYSHLLGVLEEQRDSIQQDKDSYTSADNMAYRSNELKGSYYTKYVDIVNDWAWKISSFERKLGYYLDDLDDKIAEVRRLCNEWNNRISMGHYEGE